MEAGPGLSVPQEPAYADKRSQDGGAWSASERAVATMATANVRRWGTDNPGPGWATGQAKRPKPRYSLTYVSRNRARLWKSLPRSTYRTTVTSVFGSTSSSKGT